MQHIQTLLCEPSVLNFLSHCYTIHLVGPEVLDSHRAASYDRNVTLPIVPLEIKADSPINSLFLHLKNNRALIHWFQLRFT